MYIVQKVDLTEEQILLFKKKICKLVQSIEDLSFIVIIFSRDQWKVQKQDSRDQLIVQYEDFNRSINCSKWRVQEISRGFRTYELAWSVEYIVLILFASTKLFVRIFVKTSADNCSK